MALWENLANSQTMYDSYIFTDQCWVFVHRLDCRTNSQPNTTIWNLVDDKLWRERLLDYTLQMSPFKQVCEIEF